MKLLQFIIGILCFVHTFSQRYVRNQSQQGRPCNTPLGDRGLCVSLKNCPQVVNLFTQLPQHKATEYSMALQRSCGGLTTYDNYPVVCCTRVVTDEVNRNNNWAPGAPSSNNGATLSPRERSEPSTTARSTFAQPTVSGETSCLGPSSESGICKPLENCAQLLDQIKKNPSDEKQKAFLRASNAICGSINTSVCCPSDAATTSRNQVNGNTVPRRLPTEEEGCGFVAKVSLNKVVGGENSEVGAWPWIALIGYNAWSLMPFKCGGTLVSARHVITAAHCIRSDLSFVRLGEYDLSNQNETRHLDINVIKKVSHPNYNQAYNRQDGRNDIAVLYLERDVQFTEWICPICMPTSSYIRTKSYIRSNPFVAGWGRTLEGGNESNVLQQLQIPVLENSVCRNSFQANNRLFSEQQFDDSVLCAGILTGGKDTCHGDSGGPLMIPELYKGITRFYLIGVVSYGIGCARIGVPGVYTSTQYFMDWIQNQIAAA